MKKHRHTHSNFMRTLIEIMYYCITLLALTLIIPTNPLIITLTLTLA